MPNDAKKPYCIKVTTITDSVPRIASIQNIVAEQLMNGPDRRCLASIARALGLLAERLTPNHLTPGDLADLMPNLESIEIMGRGFPNEFNDKQISK